MSTKNPFSLSFGRKPNEYISRYADIEKVIETFTVPPVTDQIYVLTGVRGSGKTVAMTEITERIQTLEDWIVIKITPVENILDALYKILMYEPRIRQIYLDAKIDMSLFGVKISAAQTLPEWNLVHEIDNILKVLQESNIKLLVAIDEVTGTTQMCDFISAFQLFITNNRPIYFLATALFEQIDRLRNMQNLTFLYRAPQIVLSPLDKGAIAATYTKIFECTKTQAIRLANVTGGYPLAFQLLGYIMWDHKDEPILSESILEEFDHRLADTAYTKLWEELSETDRKVMIAISKSNSGSVKDVRGIVSMDNNKFNQYRLRLKKRGLIDVAQYGAIRFALPRFKEFLEIQTFEYFVEE